MPAGSRPNSIRFGPFEADLRSGELRRNGRKIRLQTRPFQLLFLLLENPGEVITREEIRNKIWGPGTFVELDHSLGTAVNKLRAALDDSADNPRYIETLPKRGFRFIGKLHSSDPASSLTLSANDPSPRSHAPYSASTFSLRRALALSLVALPALAVALLGARAHLLSSAAGAPVQSLAVLPLENLSADPEQRFFADGMTDELITSLAQISSLRVISRTSVMRYAGTHKPIKEIASELGVDAIVEGTILRTGHKVRITAQLIQASTDRHLWADEYDRDATDVFALQNEVARDIASSIHLRLTSSERARLNTAPPIKPEIADLYWKGIYFTNKLTIRDFRQARSYFEQILQIDPKNARAWAGIAMVDHHFGVWGDSSAFESSKAAAYKALELDDSLVEPRAELAMVTFIYDWNIPESDRQFRRAIELNPNYARSHFYYAMMLAHTGRSEQAIREFNLARALDPLSVNTFAFGWHVYYPARQYDQAMSIIQDCIKMDPDFAMAHVRLSWSWERKGQFLKAIDESHIYRVLADGDPNKRDLKAELLRKAYLKGGARGYWLQKLAFYNDPQVASDPFVSQDIASLYAHLANEQKTLEWLEKAYQLHDPYVMYWLAVAPEYDPFRSNPRFQNLIRALGLPQTAASTAPAPS